MVTFTEIREHVQSKDWKALAERCIESKTLGFHPPLNATTAKKVRQLMLACAMFAPNGSHGYPNALVLYLDDIQDHDIPKPTKKPECAIGFAHSETGWLEVDNQTPLDFLFLIAGLYETRRNHVYSTDEEGLVTAIDFAGQVAEHLNDICCAFGVLLANTDPGNIENGDMCNIGWTVASLNRLACKVQTACADMNFALGKMQKKEAA